jgi:hypothetical protein
MSEKESDKKGGAWLQLLLVPIVVAICVGGTSPWWWKDLKDSLGNKPQTPSPSAPALETSSPVASSTTPNPENSNIPTPINSPTPSPSFINSSTTVFTQSNEGLTFQLKGCRKENETLRCEFFITDKKENRKLYIYARSGDSSRVIDPQGTQYIAKSVDFGGTENSSSVYQNLVQGIGLKAFITFDKMPTQLNQLALVEVLAWTQSQGYFTVRFRDISVSN